MNSNYILNLSTSHHCHWLLSSPSHYRLSPVQTSTLRMKSESLGAGPRYQRVDSFSGDSNVHLGFVYLLPKGIRRTGGYYYHFAKAKQESQRGYVTCPRPHSLEEPRVRSHSRPIGSPKCLISCSLKSVIYKGLSLRAEESGDITKQSIVSRCVFSQNKSTWLFTWLLSN